MEGKKDLRLDVPLRVRLSESECDTVFAFIFAWEVFVTILFCLAWVSFMGLFSFNI